MYKGTQAGYMGAEWIRASLKVDNMSEFGAKVADLLGDLFLGIYHLESDKLLKVDWSSAHHIEFALGWKSMSTFDDSLLTNLVLLAHQRAIRVQISGRTHHFLTLMFHPREHGRDKAWHRHHPTIEEAVRRFKAVYPGEDVADDHRPSWSSAPEWASYLAQDFSGAWGWYEEIPVPFESGGFWQVRNGSRFQYASPENLWMDSLVENPKYKREPETVVEEAS